jgi:ubiquinone/menaquinone biosynthesis C-methylase UbiE
MSGNTAWDALLQMLSPHSGQRILDVGAGRGDLAARISGSGSGIEVYAVDPNAKKVDEMKRRHSGVKAATAGAESLPFPDGFFDGVYTTMALHHYADLDRALAEIARVLKPQGSLVVLEVDPGSAKGSMFRLFGRIMGEHMDLMTEEQLSSRLSKSDSLKVVRSSRVGSGYLIQLSRA